MTARRQPARRRPAETDLYAPVRDWLSARGYTVRGEVHSCDIAATKDDELIIIELKCALNIQLLAQAAVRQRVTDSVYVAVPRPRDKRKWMRENRDVLHLLRRLEMGLILVGLTRGKPPVDLILHPETHERHRRNGARRAMLREIERRSGDHNEGGSSRRKIMTAYREEAIRIAVYLDELGPSAPRTLRSLGTGEKTLSILRSNFYGWFERVERGVYALSPKGREGLRYYAGLVSRHVDHLAKGDTAAPVVGG